MIHRADLQATLLDAIAATRHPPELGATVARHLPQPMAWARGIAGRAGVEVVPAAALVAPTVLVGGARGDPGRRRTHADRPHGVARRCGADIARDLVAMDRVGLWLGPERIWSPSGGAWAAVNIVATVAEQWDKRG